ncbi:nucleotide pyrophosphohydrolase [bacterium]|nr:nucleotide pyrophosphohydrolase [bacterium]
MNEKLIKRILKFRKDRDWEQYHKPKDLAVSIVIEAAELLENFQWKSDGEVQEMLSGEKRIDVEEEIADIAMYLTYLSHDLKIDLEKVMSDKLEKNRKKYPSDIVRGSAKKYDEY